MKYLLIYITFFISTIIGCKKPPEDDLSGERTIRGTVFLSDTLNGIYQPVLLANQTIVVKTLADSGTQNFLFSVQSDPFGNFIFNNLSPNSYTLYSVRDSNNIVYSSSVSLSLLTADTSLNITLYPDSTKYNLLSIICRDNLTKGLLTNIPVCLFTSLLVADSNNCKGSFFSGVTNSFGRLTVTALAAGEIYINANDSVGLSEIAVKDSVNMPVIGIRQKELFLK